jgi:hypothetical protein
MAEKKVCTMPSNKLYLSATMMNRYYGVCHTDEEGMDMIIVKQIITAASALGKCQHR